MHSPFRIPRKARIAFSKLGSLLLLFQRTPLVQVILPEARVMSATGVGELSKWTVAVVAGLGAFDTVAGATFLSAPVIKASPASVTIKTGATATLRVVATGTSLSYQWYQGKSGVITKPIPKATAASYRTPALTDKSYYWVRVRNLYGFVSSKSATVKVSKLASPRLFVPFQLRSPSQLVK
ncbi:MAG: hypothetical protein ABIT37_08720 [Luteolibacter sp.]